MSTSTDCLQLTAYFGERARTGGRFLADAILELYGDQGVPVSVLLRGAEGFGLRHGLRTDRLLTLSEDLPFVAIAVGGTERIQALAPRVQELGRNGLVTLERARLVTGSLASHVPGLTDDPQDGAKLTVFVGRRQRAGGTAAFVAVCELLRRHGVDGATVLLGVDGTDHGERTRARFFSTNADVPMMITAVGAGAALARALPDLDALLPRRPPAILERVVVCKRDGEVLRRPHALPGVDEHGHPRWQKLTVYSSPQYRGAGGAPAHSLIIRALRDAGHAGATTLRGVWGFHGDHAAHGDRLLQVRRHAPAVTLVVDAPDRIAAAFAIVDELTPGHGLVTSEVVPALVMRAGDEHRGGLALAGPRP